MGMTSGAICKKCGKKFEYRDGGGFYFHLLRCDKCGKSREIGFDDIHDLHMRYLKGRLVLCGRFTGEEDEEMLKSYPGGPLSDHEYHRAVEGFARNCRCKGRFTFDAPPRCPKCTSVDLENDPDFHVICYD